MNYLRLHNKPKTVVYAEHLLTGPLEEEEEEEEEELSASQERHLPIPWNELIKFMKEAG
jgi:hypothetical protein